MNYSETVDFLTSAMPSFQNNGITAYKPGLERITEFCRKIGNPQRDYFIIHIAGTNGKGSVAHMLASILQSAGYQTGLFTSPHLTDFRERIKVNGEMIIKQKVVNFVDKYKADMLECELSFFEMTTALAFHHFAQSDVEVAVIETGLGGRLDATNIVIPMVSVITNIGLEHTALLGDTLAEIAREKGGIIKKSIPVILGERNAEYLHVIEALAAEQKSAVIYADDMFECCGDTDAGERRIFEMVRRRDGQHYRLCSPLTGDCQRQNIATVAAVAEFLHENTPLTISRRAFVEGVRDTVESTSLRGRWQIVGTAPLTICDTGHNAHGFACIGRQLARRSGGKLCCVLGFCDDKDIAEILRTLPADARCVFTRADVARAAGSEQMLDAARTLGLDAEFVGGVPAAIERARSLLSAEDTLFIGGSTFVVAEALAHAGE